MTGNVVLESARPLPPGWFKVEVDALAAPSSGLTLVVEHDAAGREVSEYALAPMRKSRAFELISILRPIRRIRLARPSGATAGVCADAAVRVSRLSTLELWRLAFRIDPRETGTALWLRIRGKGLRSRNRLARVLGSPPGTDYRAFLAAREPVWSDEIAALAGQALGASNLPAFTVILDLAPGERIDRGTLASLARQAAAPVQLMVLGGEGDVLAQSGAPGLPHPVERIVASVNAPLGRTLGDALDRMNGQWLVLLRNGDRLAEGALLRIADAARRNPDARAITGDHDLLDGDGHRRSPAFKPAWNEPYFLACDYVGRAVAFSRAAVLAGGGFRDVERNEVITELLLRLTRLARPAGADPIPHIPRLLLHVLERSEQGDPARRRVLVEQHLADRGGGGEARIDRNGFVRVSWPLEQPAPRVSLIVPIRDRVDLLRPCVEGLLHKTAYAPIELIIVDNGSVRAATRAYLDSIAADPRVRIVPAPGPFNFAAINNRAVQVATGELIGFVNNDIEVIEPNWLAEMAGHAARPGIGAVGAKLLYPSGNVQHAGVVLGLYGLAGHAHRFFPAEHMGYQCRLQVTQHVAAVTAACMIVAREKFLAAGGFDEVAFPVAFNDVDLCLRLQRRGYRNLFTPYAELYHKESASRAHDASRRRSREWAIECDRLRERWGDVIRHDPHYSEHLTREREDFSLAAP